MHYSTQLLQVLPGTTEQSRQRLMAAVLAYAAGGSCPFATPEQQHYASQFKRGRLTIDEVIYYLEATATRGA